ncbi:MAG: PKD domain-containing protein [Anditalea sp.]
MRKKQRTFTGLALLLLFLGPIISGISVETVFQKLGLLEFIPIIIIDPKEAHIADFELFQEDSCATQAVKFTNTSTGNGLSYSWDFGDPNSKENNSSSQDDPSHTFIGNPGNGSQSFSVTLTAEDADGETDAITKTVTVKQSPSLDVGSDMEQTTFDNLPFYIVCENNSSEFTFYNNSSTKDTNEKYEIDWGDGSAKFVDEDWATLTHTYSLGIYKITYTITGENGCVASKDYRVFVGSNPAVGFGNPGNTNICTGDALSFPITGTENNPPGTTYTVTFSDGSDPQIFSHPPPETVEHVFQSSSCGAANTPDFPNSFSAKIIAENPCSASSATVAPIYATETPVPEMELPSEPLCVGTPTSIRNITIYGNEVSNNGNCSDQGMFIWQITPGTGWELPSGSLGSQADPDSPNSWAVGSQLIQPIFTEPGTYTITLISGNRCGIEEKQETICVIPEPVLSFTLDQEEGCGPFQVKTTNESNTLAVCDGGSFDWTVSYAQGDCGTQPDWEFAPGSDENSESPVFNFNNPGEYTIHLTAEANCGTFTEQKKVMVYAPPSAEILYIEDVCGSVTITPGANVTACGSTEPTYKWTFEDGTPASSTSLDPGEIEFDLSGAKTVSLEVTTSCGTITATETFMVNEPPTLDAGEDMEICNGEEIALTPTVSPEANSSFRWTSTPSGTNSNLSNPTVAPQQTTTYTFTVTDQDTGCTMSDEVTITVIPAPVIEFSIPDQIICSKETSLPVSISTLPPGATIQWISEANGVTGVGASGTSEIPLQTLVNNSSQPLDVTYTAEITSSDQGECSVVPATYTITVNPEPFYANEQLEICSGSPFDFTPEDHIPGTLYTWEAADISAISGTSDQDVPQNSLAQTLTNSGNTPVSITYTVTPILGLCPGEDFELTVIVQPSPAIDFSIPDQVICTGNPSEEMTIESEVPGASFSWVAKANGVQGVSTSGNSNTVPVQNLVNLTDQPIAVAYEIIASTQSQDACEGTPQIYTITVNPSLKLNHEVSNYSGFQISCYGANDGTIQINPSGGDGNYQIVWSGPNGFTSSDLKIEDLQPGKYDVEISDGSGCHISESFEINQPAPLGIELIDKTDVLCAGESTGAISIKVIGGVETEDYSFIWTRNGQKINEGAQNATNIPAGNYQVTVVDNNNCAISLDEIEISEPEGSLAIAVEKGDISCYNANDGFIKIEVEGGQAPYSIQWDFGSSQTAFDNLGPGIYTVTVQDNVGCSIIKPIEIIDAPVFTVSPEVENISCYGNLDGSIKLNLEGKGPQVTIRWDHGIELENLFNLSAGSYGVTITDPEGCEIRQEFVIHEPAPLVLESRVTDAMDCLNPQSGGINLGISGGTPPFNIRWSNGESVQNLTDLSAGQYGVEVEDASGCTTSSQFLVKRPDPLSVSAFRSADISCEPREIQEEIRISVGGGMAPYTITWSGGSISENGRVMTTNRPGLYLLDVTDGNGCQYQESFDVKNSAVILGVDIQSTAFELYHSYLVNFEIQFQNNSIGQISSYFWDFGDGNTSFEENPKHTYLLEGEHEITLTVTDIYGCETQMKKNIQIFDYYLVIPNVFTPNDDGVNDYFFPKFLNIEKLDFWVLNKWGETIYHTQDLESEGWDGQIDGESAMPGNYVYKLSFHTLDGRSQIRTDVFLLLK